MHILMVLDHAFPPDLRVENEIQTLIAAGIDVTLLAIAPDDRPGTDTHLGARIIRDRLPKKLRNVMRGLVSTVPLMDRYIERRVGALHAEFGFDAIHAHDLYLVGGALRAGKRLGLPVVADLHENWVEALRHYAWSTRAPGRWVVNLDRWARTEQRWVNAADRLVVVIEEAAARYEAMGVDPGRMTVLPNYVQLASFEGYALDPDLIERLRSPLTLVYTGGIDAHRGLESAVRAMPSVLESVPGARFVIVGDGRTRGELEALVEQLGLQDSVLFEGWQPQERIRSYTAAADVCLIPHLRTVHTDATIPHKLFHAMVTERPVVVSNCRPLQRIVESAQAGVVFEAGNADSLASAVQALHASPDGRARMGTCGREAVLDRYHWEAAAAGLVAMYRDLEGRSDS